PSTGAVTTTTETPTTTVEFCQKATTVPFYRMYRLDVHDHFYTTNAAEVASAKAGGYAEEGVVGFILPAKAPNSVELYRLYRHENHDHFYTTSQPERANAIAQLGYKDEGIAGYVYQASGAGCPCPELRPLYRTFHAAPIVDHFYTMDSAERAQVLVHGHTDEGIAACIYPPA
ncbi:hypothetical protein AAVH_33962, partial [Aphelenchoides avenae]